MTPVSHSVEECIKSEGVSTDTLKDLKPFYELLEKLSSTTSKNTHYDRLDEWSTVVYGYVHGMLNKYKFVNGGMNQNPDAKFWWKVYAVVSNVIYSPNLKSMTTPHHSSAWERNEALKLDIKSIIDILGVE